MLWQPRIFRVFGASKTTCGGSALPCWADPANYPGSLDMSLHPISDKGEVSVDFPDKAYIGSFGRHSQFDAYADDDSVAVRLVRPGEDRREAVMHLHYGLLADILVELARSLASRPELDEQHRTDSERGGKTALRVFGAARRDLTLALDFG